MCPTLSENGIIQNSPDFQGRRDSDMILEIWQRKTVQMLTLLSCAKNTSAVYSLVQTVEKHFGTECCNENCSFSLDKLRWGPLHFVPFAFVWFLVNTLLAKC